MTCRPSPSDRPATRRPLIRVSKRISSAIQRTLKGGEPETYDAFISYSRSDIAFARALESVLERYRPPRELDLPDRTLRVFRDEGDLTGTEYFRAIDGKLDASSTCILLCSPRAAASKFVNDEVQRFIDKKSADRVIPLLIDGLPNNEAGDEQAALAAFPPALVASMEMPLATDYRVADPARQRLSKPPFENQWYTVLANLFGISRERLEQRDRIRQARRRRYITLGTTAIIAALTALSVAALIQRHRALVSLAQSESRELANRSLNPPLGDPVYSLVNALEAADRAETFEAETALRQAAWDHRVHAILPHDAPVKSARFRPGRPSPGEILTLTDAGRVLWWRADSGTVRHDLSADTLDALDARFDPTGRYAVISHASGDVRIWRLDDLNLRTIPAHADAVDRVAISADGSRLVTAGEDGFVRLWSLPDGGAIAADSVRDARCISNKPIFGGLAFSPDGSRLAIDVCDGRTLLRDGRTLRAEGVLGSGAGTPGAVAFSGSGERLAVIRGASVQFWNVADRQMVEDWWPDVLVDRVVFFDRDRRVLALGVGPVGQWPDSGASDPALQLNGLRTVRNAVVSADGRWLLTGGADRQGVIWQLATGTPVAQLNGHRHEIQDVDFSPDGDWALTASRDSTVRVWMIDPESHTSFAPAGADDEFRYSTDGRYVLHWHTTGTVGGPIVVWDRLTDSVTLRVDTPVLGPGFGPGALVSAITLPGFQLGIWDASTGALLREDRGGIAHAFNPSGETVARWTGGHPIAIWNVATGRADTVLGMDGEADYAVFSPTGASLAAATPDGTIYVWRRGEPTAPAWILRGHRGRIHYAAFEGDTMLLSASADSTARIWSLQRDTPPRVLAGHTGAVRVLAVNEDGRHAVTGSDDWTARVWDVAQGTQTALLRGHTNVVDWVQYDPSRQRILTKSQQDSTARLWDPESGRQLAVLRDRDEHGIDWVWFEGDTLMTGSKRGTVSAHPVEFDSLVARANRELPVTMTRERRARVLGCLTPELARQLGYRWCNRWFRRSGSR